MLIALKVHIKTKNIFVESRIAIQIFSQIYKASLFIAMPDFYVQGSETRTSRTQTPKYNKIVRDEHLDRVKLPLHKSLPTGKSQRISTGRNLKFFKKNYGYFIKNDGYGIEKIKYYNNNTHKPFQQYRICMYKGQRQVQGHLEHRYPNTIKSHGVNILIE